ncbi:VOC family protein [Kribbella sp. NPDC026611]|uniref:VOC family protein n=1 Tax=Kribbella sp. NPDC026611 TaxID=3154911 RepID=UPI00340696C5
MSLQIRNIVFACPGNTPETYAEGARPAAMFYARLLGLQIIREDWIVVGDPDDPSALRLAFGDGPIDYDPPRWPDPAHPQQLHLDIAVPDLTAAPDDAALLHDYGDHRVYADPIGHPFCLYEEPTDRARVTRVVIDCADPQALAAFYSRLLDLPDRELDTPDRVVLTGSPAVAFQRSTSEPPRWPDPAYPQQVHLDLFTTDVPAGRSHAVASGAQPLQTTGSNHHVYADPAGHPFCL